MFFVSVFVACASLFLLGLFPLAFVLFWFLLLLIFIFIFIYYFMDGYCLGVFQHMTACDAFSL